LDKAKTELNQMYQSIIKDDQKHHEMIEELKKNKNPPKAYFG